MAIPYINGWHRSPLGYVLDRDFNHFSIGRHNYISLHWRQSNRLFRGFQSSQPHHTITKTKTLWWIKLHVIPLNASISQKLTVFIMNAHIYHQKFANKINIKFSFITTYGHLAMVGMELVVGCSGRTSYNEETSCQETEVGRVSRNAQIPGLKAKASSAHNQLTL